MSFLLEAKKLKRSGYLPAFLACGLLAAAFPLMNMLIRAKAFTSLTGEPFNILMNANWQMLSIINILIIICGACTMYYNEYADNAIQKMEVLPIHPVSMFLGKFSIAGLVLSAMVLIETVVLVGCAFHWFPAFEFNLIEAVKSTGFQIAVTLPTLMLMLVIASVCKNMWVSLGIGVILVFTLSILSQESLILSLLPFSSPYQTLATALENGHAALYLGVCGIETIVFGIAELVFQKIRR